MDTSLIDSLEFRLAERARKGDRIALDELASRLRGLMFATTYPICGNYDDAQDAVASALFRVCQHIGKLRDPAQIRSFILRIARREALRLRQKQSITLPLSVQEISGDTSTLLRIDVERALKELPDYQARAISLFYFQGLTIGEIAQRLERPEGTIKYWLHRGRAHLHTTLEGYEPMTKPTETAEATLSKRTAALIATEFSADKLNEMTAALRSAGWMEILLLNQPAEFLQREVDSTENPSRLILHRLLSDCQLIVLDDWVGGHSAFALSHLIRAGAGNINRAILLLADGTRSPAENDATVMAAYIGGFDMLLMKPFDNGELESFALRILKHTS